MTARHALGALVVLVVVFATSDTTRGFATLGSKWPNGSIVVNLQLTPPSGSLIDGHPNFDAAATTALATLNQYTDLVKFSAVPASTRPRGDGDLVNHVFFDSRYYNESFGPNTLAVTTRWTIGGTQRAEGDVVFNTAFAWNSYRGNVMTINGRETWDLVRVAMHEFGHLLGLDHPDEQGQSVNALMNSRIGNLDSLTADDIAGLRALYGAGGVTSNISFPPRNETNDFFRQLLALYENELRAARVTTYLDDEGKVVWIAEYTYYRVGQCDHSTAQSRIFRQIIEQITIGVCALTPAGSISFPPRNEGLQFMVAVDDLYRTQLGRSALTSFVDGEGAVVWVMEYLRYRLNGCGHGDAVSRVFAQIRGQGTPPVCRP